MRAERARSSAASLMVVLLGLSPAAPALARDEACVGIPVIVCGWSRTERERICAAAARALDFLGDAGLPPPRPVRMRPLQLAPGNEDAHCLGHFDASQREIRVLPYEDAVVATNGHARAFDLPMTRGLWQSYVAHEVAHAAIEDGFAEGAPRFTASEYVAGVVQIATMDDADRSLVLDRYRDVGAFGGRLEISGQYYLIDPARFAVKAYLHYVDLGAEAPEFVARLLREGLPN
jgi:hypothetical protein